MKDRCSSRLKNGRMTGWKNLSGAMSMPMRKFPSRRKRRKRNDRLLKYISLGSGSSGNSCYVGTSRGGIIIDAGVKSDVIESSLKSNGIDIKNVAGVLLTHDHSDHVRYVYTLLRNNKHLRLYCTNRVLTGILRRHSISKGLRIIISLFLRKSFQIA